MNTIKTDPKYQNYNSYAEVEWGLFSPETSRYQALLRETEGIDVESVLDIGCGAGQEMLPFIVGGAKGFGLDVAAEVGQVGRKKYGESGYGSSVNFLRSSGDSLPFKDESFDVLICRGAIMFMKSADALSEFARVMKKGGVLFLMIQAPAYYWWKFRKGFSDFNVMSSVHAGRVLLNGGVYGLTGKQVRNKLMAGGEIYLTREGVKRRIEPLGLRIAGEMPCTNEQTPSLIIRKA